MRRPSIRIFFRNRTPGESRELEWPAAFRAVEALLLLGIVTLLALVGFMAVKAAFMITPTFQPTSQTSPAAPANANP
jgi:hypothetical protein